MTKTLPTCCTGSAPVRSQIAENASARSCLSIVPARTLISSCGLRAESISAMTASVRPFAPMTTIGLRLCAWALSSFFSWGVIGGLICRAMAKSSKQWLRRHVTDPYVRMAKEQGYRSRAAFKLLEINEKEKLLRAGALVVDLGAAPDGWSQVAPQKVKPGGRLIAVELLPIVPIPGVTVVKAD